MKGRVVILDEVDGRRAAALMVDGKLHDILIDPPEGAAPGVGAIARAKADRPLKGQGGITLQLGDGVMGYMRRAKDIAPGDVVLVQVSGVAEPGKAAPVTPDLIFKSRYAIVTPRKPGLNVSRAIRDEDERDRLLEIAHDSAASASGFGLIVRSSAEGVLADVLSEDIAAMCATAADVMVEEAGAPEWLLDADDAHVQAWRDWDTPDEVIEGGFADHGVLEAVDAALSPHQPLPGGASAFIEATRALIAVDVNTGTDHSLAAGLKANLALVRELPRLTRIKGLGGQFTLDLAPMPKRDRKQVEDAVKKAFRLGGGDVVVAGWTPLGNLELTSKRDRAPLAQVWPR
ncbi:ribonuclease E/G [Jannaschia sp. CCS1]|uniref:ribonuclease E/G n=1 Tax=Jannaschia sp. (strain CCS1) TaxID=290400 RepID=UPI000053BE8F|nr:ribonuclease E/G [Jannaschia sp. CCS1]ABD55786.1 ribonuclease Rne/Rng family [Jannaschia sp. CCS1]